MSCGSTGFTHGVRMRNNPQRLRELREAKERASKVKGGKGRVIDRPAGQKIFKNQRFTISKSGHGNSSQYYVQDSGQTIRNFAYKSDAVAYKKMMVSQSHENKIPQISYAYTDSWGCPVYSDLNNSNKEYVVVDGKLHTMTKEGEPLSPVKFPKHIEDAIAKGDKKPQFIKEPYGLDRDMQPTGKFDRLTPSQRKRITSNQKADEIASRELELYTENDAELYRQQMTPIEKNLDKKYKNGTYDSEKALVAFTYLVDNSAKKYSKDFSNDGDHKYIFNKATRIATARKLRDNYEDDKMLEKKYK